MDSAQFFLWSYAKMKNKEIERESLLLEIQSRKEVLKKIENAYKRLKHQDYIMHNKRGTAFFISSPQNRSNIDIVTSRCSENY